MAVTVEPALSPHLTVDDAAAAIDFYVKAFGAVEVGRVPRADGKLIHAAVRINGQTVMLNDDFPEMCGGAVLPVGDGQMDRHGRAAQCPRRNGSLFPGR